MVAGATDSPDNTRLLTRFSAVVAGSPFVFGVGGAHTINITIPTWARSLAVIVKNTVQWGSLSIRGLNTGAYYLNSNPALDGGIHYCPVFPVIDPQIQMTAIPLLGNNNPVYLVAIDEPLSVTSFNDIGPSAIQSEHSLTGSPATFPVNATTTLNFAIDVSTSSLRLSFNQAITPTEIKVVGHQSGGMYADITTFSQAFSIIVPTLYISDTSYDITVTNGPVSATILYVSAINGVDGTSITPGATPALGDAGTPGDDLLLRPNKLPFIQNMLLNAGATLSVVAAAANVQYRLYGLDVENLDTTGSIVELQDTNGNVYARWIGTTFWIHEMKLFGMLVPNGAGILFKNISGVNMVNTQRVQLWYSRV